MFLSSNNITVKLLKTAHCLVNNTTEGSSLKTSTLAIAMRYLNASIYFRKLDNKMLSKNYIVKT